MDGIISLAPSVSGGADWDDQAAFLTHANRPPAGAVVLVVMVLNVMVAMAGRIAWGMTPGQQQMFRAALPPARAGL